MDWLTIGWPIVRLFSPLHLSLKQQLACISYFQCHEWVTHTSSVTNELKVIISQTVTDYRENGDALFFSGTRGAESSPPTSTPTSCPSSPPIHPLALRPQKLWLLFLFFFIGWWVLNLITGVNRWASPNSPLSPCVCQPSLWSICLWVKTIYNVRDLWCILGVTSSNNQYSFTTKERGVLLWSWWCPLTSFKFWQVSRRQFPCCATRFWSILFIFPCFLCGATLKFSDLWIQSWSHGGGKVRRWNKWWQIWHNEYSEYRFRGRYVWTPLHCNDDDCFYYYKK